VSFDSLNTMCKIFKLRIITCIPSLELLNVMHIARKHVVFYISVSTFSLDGAYCTLFSQLGKWMRGSISGKLVQKG
jgi:hypothetical protein